MPKRKTTDEWEQTARAVIADMQSWNRAHPHSTWAELESAVDRAIAPLRTELLEASVQEHPWADFRGAAQRPCCPGCGRRVQAAGQKERTLLTWQNQPVRLERTHGRCPDCGTVFFPPG
jgi:hypothetical protein